MIATLALPRDELNGIKFEASMLKIILSVLIGNCKLTIYIFQLLTNILRLALKIYNRLRCLLIRNKYSTVIIISNNKNCKESRVPKLSLYHLSSFYSVTIKKKKTELSCLIEINVSRNVKHNIWTR